MTRKRLLDACATLVTEQGFRQIGIVEIGAAAGVTGSAIYRHFESKTDMLVALLERVIDDLLEMSSQALAAGVRPEGILDELIDRHVAFSVENRNPITIWSREKENVPPEARARLRRKQRVYLQRWAEVLCQVRPDLPASVAMGAVEAVFGLMSSVADFRARTSISEQRELLSSMTRAALLGANAAVGASRSV